MENNQTMRGAIVFLAVFVIFLLVTLGYATMPPGKQIYDGLGFPTTEYKVLGLPASTLIVAIFNGVVFGIIAWIIYTIVERVTKRSRRVQQGQ